MGPVVSLPDIVPKQNVWLGVTRTIYISPVQNLPFI